MHGPYLKQSQTGVDNFSTVHKQPAVDGWSVATVTNKGAVRASTRIVSVTVADDAL